MVTAPRPAARVARTATAPRARDNRCYTGGRPPICLRICQQSADCRGGYACQPVSREVGICVPDPSEPFPLERLASSPFPIRCEAPTVGEEGLYSFDFEVHPTSTSYMVVPFAADGKRLYPEQILFPTRDSSIDFGGTNAFQAINSRLDGSINAVAVPGTEALFGQLRSGTHTFNVRTDSENICHYVLQEEEAGTTIDLNVYLVDVPGLDAAIAPPARRSPGPCSFRVGDLYQPAGLTLGTVRYFDITGDAAQNYGVIRRDSDSRELARQTQPPGPTVDDRLSVNVIFVRGIATGGGTLGMSLGLPGPAGLHGTRNSGVVFTAEYLGRQFTDRGGQVVDGNSYTGLIVAHEVGHYLGLAHTTESSLRQADPLDDTPRCSSSQDFPDRCPDLKNLMFPLAGADHIEITPGQIYMMRVNPLTKP